MKHLFFALLYFFATVATAQTLSEYPDFERYQKDNERIIQNKTYPKVIFIGNSITDGWASKRPVFFTGHQFYVVASAVKPVRNSCSASKKM